jgi:hypothetical protein
MAYTYDSEYDSYTSRPLSRSMSRQKSIGYSGIAYPHSSYSDGVPVTNVPISFKFTVTWCLSDIYASSITLHTSCMDTPAPP